MPPKSKVDLYAAIRRDVRSGMSNRALQRKYGVGFRTVKAAMESVWPEPRKQLPPRKTRLDVFKPVIDQMLRVDLDAPRKQRHTVKRIFDRLLDEHGAVEVTYEVDTDGRQALGLAPVDPSPRLHRQQNTIRQEHRDAQRNHYSRNNQHCVHWSTTAPQPIDPAARAPS